MNLVLLALIPPLYLMYYVNKLDKVEKEPFGLIARVFILGVLSVIPILIGEIAADYLLVSIFHPYSTIYIILENFLGVALIEEAGKYFAAKSIWKNPEFNYRFDAIVYCVTAALGFAAIENLMYVLQHGVATGIMRAVLSVPSHAIDGVFMGIYFGEAKFCEVRGNLAGKKSNLSKAIIIPMLLHGFYDALLSFGNGLALIVFFAFVIILDIVAIKHLKSLSKGDTSFYPTTGYMYDSPAAPNSFGTPLPGDTSAPADPFAEAFQGGSSSSNNDDSDIFNNFNKF